MGHQTNSHTTTPKKMSVQEIIAKWGIGSAELILRRVMNGDSGRFAVLNPNGVIERFDLVVEFEL